VRTLIGYLDGVQVGRLHAACKCFAGWLRAEWKLRDVIEATCCSDGHRRVAKLVILSGDRFWLQKAATRFGRCRVTRLLWLCSVIVLKFDAAVPREERCAVARHVAGCIVRFNRKTAVMTPRCLTTEGLLPVHTNVEDYIDSRFASSKSLKKSVCRPEALGSPFGFAMIRDLAADGYTREVHTICFRLDPDLPRAPAGGNMREAEELFALIRRRAGEKAFPRLKRIRVHLRLDAYLPNRVQRAFLLLLSAQQVLPLVQMQLRLLQGTAQLEDCGSEYRMEVYPHAGMFNHRWSQPYRRDRSLASCGTCGCDVSTGAAEWETLALVQEPRRDQ